MDALQRNLGHRFDNVTLLHTALTHASRLDGHRGESYQRLEFVGDRVLGLTIATALYQRFPDADEGALARRLNALVRRETCADRALALGIDAALKLSPAEEEAGGRLKTAILADACEAVLAAIHIDAGYEAAQRVILATWEPLLSGAAAASRDPKTELQERLQARGERPPAYELVGRDGPDHKPVFQVEVAGEAGALGRGTGGTKREAEQAAARAALAALNG